MKTRDIALGGIFAALFLAASYFFSGGTRAVQTVMNIARITIVACYIQRKKPVSILIFTTSVFLLSLFMLPVLLTMTHVITSLFLGVVIGKITEIKKTFLGIVMLCSANALAFVYEMIIYKAFTGINLYKMYKNEYSDIANIMLEANGNIHSAAEFFLSAIDVIVIGFLIFDIVSSAIAAYFFVKKITARMYKLKRGR